MKVTFRTVKDDKGNDVVINVASPDSSWRMVHDGVKILSLSESTGYTETKYPLFLAATLNECFTEATRLNLSGVEDFKLNVISDIFKSGLSEAVTNKVRPEDYMSKIAVKLVPTGDVISAVTTAASQVTQAIKDAKPGGVITPK